MTFRGGYERDIKEFVEKTPALKAAVEAEDDDVIETILNERFYHRPEMYYSPDKLIISYGVPATTPAFVYNALGHKPLPTREAIVTDTVDSIAARFNLRYRRTEVGGCHGATPGRRSNGTPAIHDRGHDPVYG